MRDVWIAADSIVSPLGHTSAANYERVRLGESGVRRVVDAAFSDADFYAAVMNDLPGSDAHETRIERMCSLALEQALHGLRLPASTMLLLSTTKGNIDQARVHPQHARLGLPALAQYLALKFGFAQAQVVSNACISGVLAMLVAQRWIQSGACDNVVVLGADVLSSFVVSGFQSLKALSRAVCKPFDAARDGINLGEAAAAVVLSASPSKIGGARQFRVLGGSVSNDANHISGPSRTGDELAQAITLAMQASGTTASSIDFISAHGTATVYNDEMEAKAFHRAALASVPVNSLKANFGHTLGAAGVLETVIGIHSMMRGELVPSVGFDTPGTSLPLNVIKQRCAYPLKRMLKTASGFGGCNAAMIIEKENNGG